MHKQLLNEALIEYRVIPSGPILIKAGEGGADPTRPDMEFVRTWKDGKLVPYLPGSSLKGVLRAHCERIVRTVDKEPGGHALCCDPLDTRKSCSARLEHKGWSGSRIHRDSCFVCQLFGNTSLAGHLRTADAYPDPAVGFRIEERDGVAIDRVFGSVAVGPFQLEVVTQGQFATRLTLKNFSLAQLALVALALRDLKAGRVGVGFAKSRGLGQVTARFDHFVVRYPTWAVGEERARDRLVGVAALVDEQAGREYGYLRGEGAAFGYAEVGDDEAPLPAGLALADDGWLGAQIDLSDEGQIEEVWRACMPAWRKAVRL